ncbi:hypothetical protein DV737_g3228, partial [Chaetothyriales sp. CBS 132003]
MGKLTSTIGIPIKLLNEAQGHVVTLELTSGQVYRGKLLEAEDNMNVQLKDITATARDGRVSHLDQVYIRGSHEQGHQRKRRRFGQRKSDSQPSKSRKERMIKKPAECRAAARLKWISMLAFDWSSTSNLNPNIMKTCLEMLQDTHPMTKYYDTYVMIWCDELPLPATHAYNPSLEPDTNHNGIPSHSVEPPTTDGTATDGTAIDGTADAGSSPPSPAADLAQWQSQMLSPPAFEVRSVIGGIILILPITPQQLLLFQAAQVSSTPEDGFAEYVRAVHSLRETIEDESGTGRDIASLVVLQLVAKSSEPKINDRLKELAEKLETWCHDEGIFGFDFVSWDGIAGLSSEGGGDGTLAEKNEYGEKVGIHRVREVLEGVDWTANPGTTELGENDADDPLGKEGAGLDIFSTDKFNGLDSELQQELMDISPSYMQDLMERVVAIRDAGVDLPKEERKAFAKREVDKIIRELI